MDRDEEATQTERRREKRTAEKLASLLTVDEAAAFLRVNRKTLYEAVRLRQVPGVVQLGRSIRISRDALLQWLRVNGGSGSKAKR